MLIRLSSSGYPTCRAALKGLPSVPLFFCFLIQPVNAILITAVWRGQDEVTTYFFSIPRPPRYGLRFLAPCRRLEAFASATWQFSTSLFSAQQFRKFCLGGWRQLYYLGLFSLSGRWMELLSLRWWHHVFLRLSWSGITNLGDGKAVGMGPPGLSVNTLSRKSPDI